MQDMKNAQRLYQLTHGYQLTREQEAERAMLERVVLLETHGRVSELLERLDKLEAKTTEKSLFESVFGRT